VNAELYLIFSLARHQKEQKEQEEEEHPGIGEAEKTKESEPAESSVVFL